MRSAWRATWRVIIFSILAVSAFCITPALSQGQTSSGAKRKIEIVDRLPTDRRKEIYAALVAADHQAYDDAERKYPISPHDVPTHQLAGYDWEAAAARFAVELRELTTQYKAEVLKKYRISRAEASAIGLEGLTQKWGRPAPK